MMAALAPGDTIQARAVQRRRPDGSAYQSLGLADALDLARRQGRDLYQIDSAALQQQILPERYARNTQSLSITDQYRLLDSRACIVGLGGLGGPVAEGLARIGVGRLHLIDGDCFEEHNLNRQRFAHTGNLGQPKPQAARDAIARINPAVSVKTSPVFLNATNAEDLVEGAQVVIDGLDRLDTRLILQQACRRLKIPLVSAAVAGATGQLTVIFPEDIGLEGLIGDVDESSARGAETYLGNLPFTVSALASLEVAEAVKVLLGREGLLRNRLLLFDLMEPYFEVISLG
jgi:molybdopterin/thiamine biosynthesis adenylyltransferase